MRPPRWRRSTKRLDVAGHLCRLCSSLQGVVMGCDLSDVSFTFCFRWAPPIPPTPCFGEGVETGVFVTSNNLVKCRERLNEAMNKELGPGRV